MWRRGEMFMAQKQWRQAVDCFDALVTFDPTHVPALLKLSDALLKLDRYRESRSRTLQACEHRTDHPGLVMELGRRLRRYNDSAQLLELVRASRFIERGPPPMLTEMALIVSSVGDQPLAKSLVDRAIHLDPADFKARYLRGTIAMFLGQMEAAEADLEACARIAPEFPQAHWVLSSLRTWSDSDNHVERLQKLLLQTSRNQESQGYFWFALHNELHALKRHEDAWKALERGCEVKRNSGPYDDAQTAELFEFVKKLCTPDFVLPVQRDDDYTPIFIIGMHRSGTTLLERILSGHSQVSDGGETYTFTAQLKIASDHKTVGALDITTAQRLASADFDAIGRGFIDGSRWRTRGRPFMTEKLPPNLVNAGFIAKAIPAAKILHMVRDPVDTCFSNLRTYFSNAAAYSFDQITLGNYFGHYHDLMQHWRNVMPQRILDVSYDELVSDTERCARRIFDFCGLPFEASALEVGRASGAVATASSSQVRRGILKDRGAAWKPYEPHLQPLLRQLRERGLI